MPDVRVLNELQIKKNGIVATYRLGTVNGYYNPTDGKFYEEVTHVTEIEGAPNLVYADIAGNALYIYKTATSSFVKVSGEGGGSSDNLKFGYLNDEDGKFYEDDQYQVEIPGNADYLFIELDNNTIYRYDTSDTAFVAIGGGESSGGTIEGYYNSEDGKFYQEETFVTEIPGQAGMLYVDLSENKTYRYDESETKFIVVGGGGIEYQAGFGIDITDDIIKTTDFVGTQAEWDALTTAEKEAYDFVHITDDTTNVNYSPGHAISDGTSEKTQREVLEFNGFDVTDDSVNGKTKIAEVPYTAGDGIEITNKEVSVGDEISRTWTGTKAEWDAISDKSIYDGWIVNITDDAAVGSGPVVDVVEDGNLNAVTSNAVYDLLSNKELTSNSGTTLVSINCDGVKTYQTLIAELNAAFVQACAAENEAKYYAIDTIFVGGTNLTLAYRKYTCGITNNVEFPAWGILVSDSLNQYLYSVYFSGTNVRFMRTTISSTGVISCSDISSSVPSSSTIFRVMGHKIYDLN